MPQLRGFRRRVALEFRETRLADHKSFSSISDVAEDSASSRELLRRLGIKLSPTKADLLTGRVKLWECVDDSEVVGHCAGDLDTGEVLMVDTTRLPAATRTATVTISVR